MGSKTGLTRIKFLFYLLLIPLLTTFSFGSFLKAQDEESVLEAEEGEEAAPPAPASTPAAKEQKSVIAETDGEYPDVRLEVTELKRTSGDTLTLKFTIINDSSEDMDFSYNFVEQGKYENHDFATVGGVNLVDAAGKKKYLVLRDSENKCLCSRNLKTVKPGSSAKLYAKFPAPPESVEKITVEIPHFIPMDDVPISK
jgi:hypothetical protein